MGQAQVNNGCSYPVWITHLEGGTSLPAKELASAGRYSELYSHNGSVGLVISTEDDLEKSFMRLNYHDRAPKLYYNGVKLAEANMVWSFSGTGDCTGGASTTTPTYECSDTNDIVVELCID